jgi:hypothetical protein
MHWVSTRFPEIPFDGLRRIELRADDNELIRVIYKFDDKPQTIGGLAALNTRVLKTMFRRLGRFGKCEYRPNV